MIVAPCVSQRMILPRAPVDLEGVGSASDAMLTRTRRAIFEIATRRVVHCDRCARMRACLRKSPAIPRGLLMASFVSTRESLMEPPSQVELQSLLTKPSNRYTWSLPLTHREP